MKKQKLKLLSLNKKFISNLNSSELNAIAGRSGDICQTVPRMSACNGPCKTARCKTKGCDPIIINASEIIC